HAFCVSERELRRVLTGDAGLHAILDVTLDGQKTTRPAILKQYQQDPVKGTLTHIDLQEVRLDEAIQARVVVELIGEPVGVTEGEQAPEGEAEGEAAAEGEEPAGEQETSEE